MSVHDPFSDLIAPFSRRGVDLGLERLQAALAEQGWRAELTAQQSQWGLMTIRRLG